LLRETECVRLITIVNYGYGSFLSSYQKRKKLDKEFEYSL
jgi:hypothetical protein